VAHKGGTIVTCASTSGYLHQYDNRYLWMNLKPVTGSHFANYREAWEANRLIDRGLIHPTLSKVYGIEDVGQAALDVRTTPTSARSVSSPSHLRRDWAPATRRSGPGSRPRSTASEEHDTGVRAVVGTSSEDPTRCQGDQHLEAACRRGCSPRPATRLRRPGERAASRRDRGRADHALGGR